MSRPDRSWPALLVVALLLGAPLAVPMAAAGSMPEPVLAPVQLRQDLDSLVTTLRAGHPDLSHSVDEVALDLRIAELRAGLDTPMDRNAGWRRFATLNPLLADGHVLVGFADWRGEATEHLAEGGRFFPYEVTVDAEGVVRIRSLLGGGGTPLAGRRILAINGMAAEDVSGQLLDRMHGDTPAFRAGLLSERWWLYHWKSFGAPATYLIELEGREKQPTRVPASANQPAYLVDEASLERQFRLEPLPGDAALLTVASFSWEDPEAFYKFTGEAFEWIRKKGVRTLVIDIRRNGGGDDTMWIRGLMPYLADRPYRWGSHYRKRIVARFADAGETVGDVVDGEIEDWIQAGARPHAFFDGDVIVLTGRGTYSSAILFANTMQDFGFARIAGGQGVARTRQSGGVERFLLPHSGLALWVPRFVLTRPSGKRCPELIAPDLLVTDDPMNPRQAVDEILRVIAESGSHAQTDRPQATQAPPENIAGDECPR